MNTKDLMPGQPVTEDGKAGSAVLMEIIQRLNRKVRELEGRIEALEP